MGNQHGLMAQPRLSTRQPLSNCGHSAVCRIQRSNAMSNSHECQTVGKVMSVERNLSVEEERLSTLSNSDVQFSTPL